MRKCTLIGAKHVLVDERIYCINRNENMNQTRAMQYCKELNATLPLPVSLLEFEAFSNFSSPHKAWIGISDPSNSGKKENWRNVQNKNPQDANGMTPLHLAVDNGHHNICKLIYASGKFFRWIVPISSK